MKKEEIEKKYAIHLEKAYITGGADIQPSDWLKDDVIESLSDNYEQYITVSLKGGLYVIKFDEDTREGEVIPIYGNQYEWLSKNFKALNEQGYFEFSTDIVDEYEDYSVDYFFMSHGCLFVIDCVERRAPLALHNTAQVLCVWQAPDADIDAAKKDIIEELEDGLDYIIENDMCSSVVSTEERGDNIGFAFWYVWEAWN